MIKLWYKTIKGEKITNSEIREFSASFSEQSFLVQLREVCDKFNISTPVLLRTHFKHLQTFNVLHFKPADFIGEVDFDKMDVEIVKEKKYVEKRKKM